MSIAYLLVLLGIGILAAAVWALFWAVDSGQFEDLESQGGMALEEERPCPQDIQPKSSASSVAKPATASSA